MRRPTSVGFSLLCAFRAVSRVLTFFSLIPFSVLTFFSFIPFSLLSIPALFFSPPLSPIIFLRSPLLFLYPPLSPFHSCPASSSLGIDGRWGCAWATAGVKARATDAKVVDLGHPQEGQIHGLWIRVSPSEGADPPPSVLEERQLLGWIRRGWWTRHRLISGGGRKGIHHHQSRRGDNY